MWTLDGCSDWLAAVVWAVVRGRVRGGYGGATQARLSGHGRRDLIRHLARLSPAWHRGQSLDHVSATVMSTPTLVGVRPASRGRGRRIRRRGLRDCRSGGAGLGGSPSSGCSSSRSSPRSMWPISDRSGRTWRLPRPCATRLCAAGQIGPPGPNARPTPADQLALFEETSGRWKDTMRRVHRRPRHVQSVARCASRFSRARCHRDVGGPAVGGPSGRRRHRDRLDAVAVAGLPSSAPSARTRRNVGQCPGSTGVRGTAQSSRPSCPMARRRQPFRTRCRFASTASPSPTRMASLCSPTYR